jgi:hypothetical protein
MSVPSVAGQPDPLVVNPRGACHLLSCSRKRLYQLMAEGELESFTNGRARKITVASIKRLIARGLVAATASPLKRPG